MTPGRLDNHPHRRQPVFLPGSNSKMPSSRQLLTKTALLPDPWHHPLPEAHGSPGSIAITNLSKVNRSKVNRSKVDEPQQSGQPSTQAAASVPADQQGGVNQQQVVVPPADSGQSTTGGDQSGQPSTQAAASVPADQQGGVNQQQQQQVVLPPADSGESTTAGGAGAPPPGGGDDRRSPPPSRAGNGPIADLEAEEAEVEEEELGRSPRGDGSNWPAVPDLSGLPPATMDNADTIGVDMFALLDGSQIHLPDDLLGADRLFPGVVSGRHSNATLPAQDAASFFHSTASGHLHASWINETLIAAQGPMSRLRSQEGVAAFFATALDNDVERIVNLTDVSDGSNLGLELQYWPADGVTEHHILGDRTLQVTTNSVVRHNGYETVSLSVSEQGAEYVQQITMYRFTGWAQGGVVADTDRLMNFMRALESGADDTTTLVHSDQGLGRTGTFIVLSQLFEGIGDGSITRGNLAEQIAELIWEGRISRGPQFVENAEQIAMLVMYGLAAIETSENAALQSDQDDQLPPARQGGGSPPPGAAGLVPGQVPDQVANVQQRNDGLAGQAPLQGGVNNDPAAQVGGNNPAVQAVANGPAIPVEANAPAAQAVANNPAGPAGANDLAVQGGVNNPAVQAVANGPAIPVEANGPAVQLGPHNPFAQGLANNPFVQAEVNNDPAVQPGVNNPFIQAGGNDPAVQLEANNLADLGGANNPADQGGANNPPVNQGGNQPLAPPPAGGDQSSAAAGAGAPPPPGGGGDRRGGPQSRVGSVDEPRQSTSANSRRSDGTDWPARPDVGHLARPSYENYDALGGDLHALLAGSQIHLDTDFVPAAVLLPGTDSRMPLPSHSAVAVTVDGATRYLHANALDQYNILARGPARSAEGVAGFFAGVLDSGVGRIINLTDDGDAVHGDSAVTYWPDVGATQQHVIADRTINVTTRSVTPHNGYEAVSLAVSEAGGDRTQLITVYRFTGWPHSDVAGDGDQLVGFMRALGDEMTPTNTLIHSDQGTGRAGVFYVLGQLFEGIDSGDINQDNLVEQIATLIWEGRISRGPNFVETPAQVGMLIGYGLAGIDALAEPAVPAQRDDSSGFPSLPPGPPPPPASLAPLAPPPAPAVEEALVGQPVAPAPARFQWPGRPATRANGSPWPAAPDVSALVAAQLDPVTLGQQFPLN